MRMYWEGWREGWWTEGAVLESVGYTGSERGRKGRERARVHERGVDEREEVTERGIAFLSNLFPPHLLKVHS